MMDKMVQMFYTGKPEPDTTVFVYMHGHEDGSCCMRVTCYRWDRPNNFRLLYEECLA